MKEEVKKSSNVKKDGKLKIEDIKKNSSSDVIHTIKKIKLNEAKFVGVMVTIILGVFCLIFLGISLSINHFSQDGIKSGPLLIKFIDDEGMGDIVDITDSTGDKKQDFEIVSKRVNIKNTSDDEVNYIIYVKDYNDMIKYDDCSDFQYSKDEIYYGFDNVLWDSLSNSAKDFKYVISEGKILEDCEITLDINFWVLDKSNKHFHGEIFVEYVDK